MSASKHTPGPWRVGRGSRIESCANGRIVADVTYHDDEQLAGADARLIAAAPDLLAFVRRVAQHFENLDAPLGVTALALLATVRSE